MSFDYQKPKRFSSFVSQPVALQRKSFYTQKQENPRKKSSASIDVQAQLKRAMQYGHNLSRIAISDRQSAIQTKLTIGKPGDRYEQEADRVAEQVVNAPENLQKEEEDKNQLSMKPVVQRQGEMPEKEEEEMQAKPLLQRQEAMPEKEEEEMAQTKVSDSGDRSADMEDLESQLSYTKGGGSPISEETRNDMESKFGSDFSDVRVHTDSTAVDMNQSIQAQAFTHGQDIYFNSGKYSPDSNQGKLLLAHELTHVLQQRGGK